MSWGYRPQLDGLRAVAVYLVLLFHATLPAAAGGFVGVDLFFVLSGFLVTNVIWNEIDNGRFRLGAFYSRRVRRLLPAAVVVIVATCVLQIVITPLASRLDMVNDARSALLYFSNWHFISEANDYFAQGEASSPFLHFWSLSIEEQFYIAFPLVCWLLGAKLGRSERSFGIVLGLLFAASVVAQVAVARTDTNAAYYGTHTRAYQLLAGALLALLLRHLARRAAGDDAALEPGREPGGLAASWPWALASAAGLADVLLLGSDLLDLSPSARRMLATVASVAIIGGATQAPRFLVARALALPTVRYLGQISYGTYLWHWPVTLAVREVLPMGAGGTALVVAAVATSLAALSFQVLETPIRRAKPLNRIPWPTVATGLALSGLVAVLVVAPLLEHPHRPAVVAAASTSGPDAEPPLGLVGGLKWTTRKVPANLPLQALKDDQGDLGASCADDTPESCVVVDGPETEPLVVLVGDSHAGMLLPLLQELAGEHGFRLSTNIRNKCAWVQGIHNTTERDAVNEPCRQQRSDFYGTILPAMDADLVILAQRSRDGADALLTDVVADDAADHPDESFHEMLLRHSTDTVDTIEAAGARALIVHSMLSTNGWEVYGGDPLNCLSVAVLLGDCAVRPVDPPRLDSLFDYLAVTDPSVSTVEFRDDYCPSQVLCAPVVDGLVTWKDRAHLSSTYLLHIQDAMWKSLLDSGAFEGLGVS
ncbi:hypothetical protein BH11ACT8_BH11ACT8_25270 [soil metagenome]